MGWARAVGDVITKPALRWVHPEAVAIGDKRQAHQPTADETAVSDPELRALVDTLLDRVTRLEAEKFMLAARIATLEAHAPEPRFEVPNDWLTAAQCVHLCGYSLPSIYRFYHSGRIVGVEYGGSVFIDPNSLPKKGARRHGMRK